MGFGILYLERAFEMRKEKLFLSMGDNPVELSDIRKVESVLAFTFPDEFKSLYLDCNGGAPSRECWSEDIDYEPILVESFKPIEAGSRMLDGDTSHLVGFVLSMQEKKVVPSHILPFAVDEANNFICFEKTQVRCCILQSMCFVLMLKWLSIIWPHRKSCRNHSRNFLNLCVSVKKRMTKKIDRSPIATRWALTPLATNTP